MKSEYEDHKDLLNWFESHWDLHGSPCSYVSSGSDVPDPRSFDDGQLSYYLYFRETFRNGSPVETDVGYARVLLTDLVNDRTDPEGTLALLMEYRSHCIGQVIGFPKPELVTEYAADYAVVCGLPIPRVPQVKWGPVMVSEAVFPVFEPLAPELWDLILDKPMRDFFGEPPSSVSDLFVSALPHVDTAFREKTGAGIAERFSIGTETAVQKLFIDDGEVPMNLREPLAAVEYTAVGEQFRFFLRAMYRYCARISVATKDEVSVSSCFASYLRKTVDKVFKGELPKAGYPQKPSCPSVRVLTTTPFIMSSKGFPVGTVSPRFRQNLERYRDVPSPGPRTYVPSKSLHPTLTNVPIEVVEYYLCWRDGCRRGLYGLTDAGYLWLYLCELINVWEDKDAALMQLSGLARAYGAYGRETSGKSWPGIIGKTYYDFALMNYRRIPDPAVFPCRVSACDMVDAIIQGDDVPVCAADFMHLIDTYQLYMDLRWNEDLFDDDCAKILAKVLYRVYKTGSRNILSAFNASNKPVKDTAFGNVRYYHWPTQWSKVPQRKFRDYFSSYLSSELELLMAAVAKAHLGMKQRDVSFAGVSVQNIVLEETALFFANKRVAVRRAIDIDADLVAKADADLEDVVRMMVPTETVGEYGTQPLQDTVRPTGQWSDLSTRLNKTQKEYLRSALSGKSVKDARIEKAVNAVALETIGDIIVEDGSVPEEYTGDLRNCLR